MSFYQPGWDQYYTSDNNFYHSTIEERQGYGHLVGEREYDVCVVGGGFSGLSAAYFLQRYGLKVVLLERHSVGWGASGRNGGQLLPGLSAEQIEIEKKYGQDFARRLWDYSLEGVEIVKDVINKYRLDCDYRPGAAYLGFKPKHVKALSDYVDFHRRSYGYDMDFISGDDVAAMMGTDYYSSACFMPQAGHFNPYKYIKGFANVLRSSGVSVFERTPAEAVTGKDGDFTVHSPSGVIKASRIILAGGAYLGQLVPSLRSKYVLGRCAVIATEPIDPAIEVVPANIAGCEYTVFMHFFRRCANGSFMFGGGDALRPGVTSVRTQKKIISFLCEHMVRIFPQLENVPIGYNWGGYLAMTSSQLPLVGMLEPGVFYTSGYSGHGINNAHLSGRVLADAVVDKNEDFHTFERIHNLTVPGKGAWDNKVMGVAMLAKRLEERFF